MNPQFKIDLQALFNSVYASESKQLRNKIRPILSDAQFRKLFSDLIIEEITNRTQSGIDKDGKSLGKYKDSYKKSVVFQIYKGASTKVDLTLTGDMLNDLRNFRKSRGDIVIGFGDDLNRKKAYGHITGFRGHPFIKGIQKRDFLGLPDDKLESIMKESFKIYSNAGSNNLQDIYEATSEAA